MAKLYQCLLTLHCSPVFQSFNFQNNYYDTTLQVSPKERRRNKTQMRRSQSMDFDDHDHPSESEEYQPKVFKLLSETDIQVKFKYVLICQLYYYVPGDRTEILR